MFDVTQKSYSFDLPVKRLILLTAIWESCVGLQNAMRLMQSMVHMFIWKILMMALGPSKRRTSSSKSTSKGNEKKQMLVVNP